MRCCRDQVELWQVGSFTDYAGADIEQTAQEFLGREDCRLIPSDSLEQCGFGRI